MKVIRVQSHVVYLFGTNSFNAVPEAIEEHIRQIIQQTNGNVRFIVGDGLGLESKFHNTLSSLGAAGKTTVYAMDKARSNLYDFEVKTFETLFNEEKSEAYITYNGEILDTFDKVNKPEELLINPAYYRFRDKQMIRDCTFAICYWDGESKNTSRNIDTLSALDKYCYVYKAVK